MQVREVMTSDPATCTPETSLQEVSKLMVEYDCGCIPVVNESDSGAPVGVVTDRDICCRVVAEGKNPVQARAAECMTEDAVTIAPDADVEEAARLMEEKQIRRLLVVDDRGACIGIVAQADLALEASERKAGEVVERVSKATESASRPSAR